MSRIDRISLIFFREEESVILGYIFGSVAKNDVGPLSDVDIAVHLEEVSKDMEYRLKLMNELEHILSENLDLVIMNESSSLMNYNIVSEGENIYCKSETSKAVLESRIVNTYLDRKYYDDRHAEIRLKQMSGEKA